MCPLACYRCPLADLRLATGLMHGPSYISDTARNQTHHHLFLKHPFLSRSASVRCFPSQHEPPPPPPHTVVHTTPGRRPSPHIPFPSQAPPPPPHHRPTPNHPQSHMPHMPKPTHPPRPTTSAICPEPIKDHTRPHPAPIPQRRTTHPSHHHRLVSSQVRQTPSPCPSSTRQVVNTLRT